MLRLTAWVATTAGLVLLAGCELIVDFDRSLLDEAGVVDASGPPDPGHDASADASDARVPPTSDAAADASDAMSRPDGADAAADAALDAQLDANTDAQVDAATCPAGTGECDGDPSTQCETDLLTDATHCGGCEMACSNVNGTGRCQDGSCTITCSPGWGDCDPSVAGCETDVTNNPDHCSECGSTCPAPNNAVAMCTNSMCTFECDEPFADCNQQATDGCEADVHTDLQHCGGCNKVCSGANGMASCAVGSCDLTCTPGFGDCNDDTSDGCETDTTTNVMHCGMCGTKCNTNHGTPSCTSGVCSIGCDPDFGDCDNNPGNGCETDLMSTVAHCGGCNTACNAMGGTPSCSGGSCSIACDSTHRNCDMDPANGCEIDTQSDAANCGGCGTVCAMSTPNCVAGACVP